MSVLKTIGLATMGVFFVTPLMAADKGEGYAVLVGIRTCDKAKELRTLPYRESDVAELSRALHDIGFKKENITLFSRAGNGIGRRASPTKEEIRKELNLVLQDRNSADMVVVALGGHGVRFKGDPDIYFCTADSQLADKSTMLSLKELYKDLEDCKAALRFLVVDAFPKDPFSKASKLPRDLDVDGPLHTPAPPKGVAILYSCSEDERSHDATKLRRGVFFHFLIEGLKGEAANADGDVSVLALSDFVNRRVKSFVNVEFSAKQRPNLHAKDLGDTPLVRFGQLHGKWAGEYSYGKIAGQQGVRFTMNVSRHLDNTLQAWIQEPNTFGNQDEPFLFASCTGEFLGPTRKVTWSKKYDGTGGASHTVEYSGTLSANGSKIEGTWVIPEQGNATGPFVMQKSK